MLMDVEDAVHYIFTIVVLGFDPYAISSMKNRFIILNSH